MGVEVHPQGDALLGVVDTSDGTVAVASVRAVVCEERGAEEGSVFDYGEG